MIVSQVTGSRHLSTVHFIYRSRRRLLASGWLSRNRSKLVQALRMTASSLATFALAEALGLPQEFWAVITALIVTQSNVGGSLKAALDRFTGSLLGAVYGGGVAFMIPHADGLTRAAALVVAVAPLSFMAAYSAGSASRRSRPSSYCSAPQARHWAARFRDGPHR